MFGKLKALWDLMQYGKEVSNVEFWKSAQSKGQPVLAAILIGVFAMLKGTRFEVPISDDTAMYIAGGVFATVNFVLTTITSKRAGLLPAKPVQDSVQVNQQVQQPEVIVQPKVSTTIVTTISEDDLARARAFVAGGKFGNDDKIAG